MGDLARGRARDGVGCSCGWPLDPCNASLSRDGRCDRDEQARALPWRPEEGLYLVSMMGAPTAAFTSLLEANQFVDAYHEVEDLVGTGRSWALIASIACDPAGPTEAGVGARLTPPIVRWGDGSADQGSARSGERDEW